MIAHKSRFIFLAACAGIVAGLTAWSVARVLPTSKSGYGRQLPDAIGFDQRPGAEIPSHLQLRDCSGSLKRLSELRTERPILLHLVYYRCPMLCHMTRDALIRTLNTMRLRPGRDFDVWTISFDPRDSTSDAVAVREATIQRFNGKLPHDAWRFFTLDAQGIVDLTQAVGFQYQYDEASNQFAHAAGVVVLTPEATVSRYITGVDYSARDLRFSLIEASRGSVGTVTDQALLLCFRYDPMKGRYGLAVLGAIRVLGVATVVLVLGCIGYMVSQDRNRQPIDGVERRHVKEHG